MSSSTLDSGAYASHPFDDLIIDHVVNRHMIERDEFIAMQQFVQSCEFIIDENRVRVRIIQECLPKSSRDDKVQDMLNATRIAISWNEMEDFFTYLDIRLQLAVPCNKTCDDNVPSFSFTVSSRKSSKYEQQFAKHYNNRTVNDSSAYLAQWKRDPFSEEFITKFETSAVCTGAHAKREYVTIVARITAAIVLSLHSANHIIVPQTYNEHIHHIIDAVVDFCNVNAKSEDILVSTFARELNIIETYHR